jgi:hypothetical protein
MVTAVMIGALTRQAFAEPVPDEPPGPTTDELDQAADATADVANVAAPPPVPVPVPPVAAKASSDEIDLSELGLEPGGPGFDDKLNLYGFADIIYFDQYLVRKIPGYTQDTKGFGVGNFNIYLSKNLTARARALGEFRLSFSPNGSLNADGSYVDTTAQDLADFSRPNQWGSIVIERVYVEYDVTEHLTLRVGHWLTPYGIWNIDHGSPAIVAAFRPYIIGERFFPEHQTGFDLFGSERAGRYMLNYHLTASNGRGGAEAVVDQDGKLAFGGRLEVETPWGLKLGGSFYRGRYTGIPASFGALPQTYLESAYAGDAQLRHGGLLLQGEVITRDLHYAAGQRAATGAGFAPDGRDLGFYVLAGYRFDRLWNVMPFGYFETGTTAVHMYQAGTQTFNVGLNFRPTANLVLKLQMNHTKFDEGPEPLAGNKVFYTVAQAAWVF